MAKLPRRTVFWYGIGQAAEGIKNHAFTAFLLFYYTSVLGLSGTLAGMALMIALLFDAFTDPLIAVLSDKTHSRWGRRHPYMYLSAVPLGIFFWCVFAPPEGLAETFGVSQETALFWWLLTFVILTRAAMTLYHVPHLALGAELSDDFDERTRVVTARSFLSFVGAALCGVGYFVLVDLYKSPEYSDPRLNPVPYVIFSAIFGALITFLVFASAWWTRDRIPLLKEPDEKSVQANVVTGLFRDLSETLKLQSFRALFLGFTLCFLSFGVANALGAHNAVYFWHISLEIQFLLGIGGAIGLMIGMVFWRGYAVRHDKKPAFLIGLFIFTIFAAPPPLFKAMGYFPAETSAIYIPLLFALTFLYSFGIAAAMVVTGSMMADITDEDELLHQRRREGIFFGSLSFSAKAASGLGTVIAGAAYDFVGLYQGLDPADAAPEISVQLGLITGGVILVLVGVSAIYFKDYNLTRDRHEKIQGQLAAMAAD